MKASRSGFKLLLGAEPIPKRLEMKKDPEGKPDPLL
jgi:hypothetical protein